MGQKIILGQIDHAPLLRSLAENTFLEAYTGMMNHKDLLTYVREAFTLDKIKSEILEKDSLYFIACSNQEFLGHCRIILGAHLPCLPSAKMAKLERIYVSKKAQGLGLGLQLFLRARAWAKEEGAHGLWLSVWDQHLEGQKFHRKMGFEPIGEEQFQVGRESQRDIVMYQPL